MAVHGFLMGILAQTCVALLPAPQAEIEWFSDGRPYARDIPLRTTRTERVYRRQHENGRTAERVVTCSTSNSITYFIDRVGSAAPVRLPVALKVGTSRVIERATVRRIEPPAGGSTRVLWFSVSNPGVSVYGLQPGAGVVEIRTPASTGGFAVLRGVTRDPAPRLALAEADSQVRALGSRVAELERAVSTLTDSIAVLLAGPPNTTASPDIPELTAVAMHVQRGAYHEALALLAHTRARVTARIDPSRASSRARQRALAQIDEHVHHVVSACVAARRGQRSAAPVPPASTSSATGRVTSGVPLVLLLGCAAPAAAPAGVRRSR